jgi:riboflavin transporter FmnP
MKVNIILTLLFLICATSFYRYDDTVWAFVSAFLAGFTFCLSVLYFYIEHVIGEIDER